MFGYADVVTRSACGRPKVGPRVQRSITLASISSCSASFSEFHHRANSAVYSTSHVREIVFHERNILSMEYLKQIEFNDKNNCNSVGQECPTHMGPLWFQ